MIEYSSPNTNKPLHLGHVRNNLLGWSLAQIMEANGNKVIKTNIVNDRGIHICKSMLAWLKWGNGETPETSGKKGDHLIGDYYVAFDKHYREEIAELKAQYMKEGMEEEAATEKAKAEAPLIKEAHEMLVKWENNDPEVRALWQKMNSWVYAGFDETYKMMGLINSDVSVNAITGSTGAGQKPGATTHFSWRNNYYDSRLTLLELLNDFAALDKVDTKKIDHIAETEPELFERNAILRHGIHTIEIGRAHV